MDKIYYQPNHLWKERQAIKKLKELIKEKPAVIKQWLSKQPILQVHLPHPKRVDRPHYKVRILNEMHQFNLLFVPSNTLYGNKYKYVLYGIDVSSRYKVARPLRTKQVKYIVDMIEDINKVCPLY